MGGFYGSIHVRMDDRAAVLDAVRRLARGKRRFFVSPVLNGWVGVYPSDHGQDERVSRSLAKRVDAEMLHVNLHDDDVFSYVFYRHGKIVDKYSSCPDYFGQVSAQVRSRLRGKPALLTGALAAPHAVDELARLLDEIRCSPLQSLRGIQRFGELFGLSNLLSCYEYLLAGEVEGVAGWEEFEHAPDRSGEDRRRQKEAAAIVRRKQELREGAVLLCELAGPPPQHGIAMPPVWCIDRIHDGFLLLWPALRSQQPAALQRCAPPWSTPEVVSIEIAQPVAAVQMSRGGKYLAAASGGGVSVRRMDGTEQQFLMEEDVTRWAAVFEFTPDEGRLITADSASLVVYDLETRRTITTCSVRGAATVAVHPTEPIAAVGHEQGIDVIDCRTGERVHSAPIVSEERIAEHDRAVAQLRQSFAGVDLQRVVRELEERQIAQGSEIDRRAMQQGSAELLSLLEGAGSPPPRSEPVFCLRFDLDGEWLFCATEYGVRVFAWRELMSSGDAPPTPQAAADSMPVEIETGFLQSTYALAHDPARNRLLFGGLEGSISFLDLTTGIRQTLIEVPGRPAIRSLAFLRDFRTLACGCTPKPWLDEPTDPPQLLVWDYARLCALD